LEDGLNVLGAPEERELDGGEQAQEGG
jgi:hypothetical protein